MSPKLSIPHPPAYFIGLTLLARTCHASFVDVKTRYDGGSTAMHILWRSAMV